VSTLASYWPAWLAIALAGMAGFYQVITEFSRFANLFGKWGRTLYQKSRERHRMDTEDFHKAVRKAVEEERQRWDEDEARELATVQERLNYFIGLAELQQREMAELSFQTRCHTAYTEYEAEWHHRLRIAISQALHNGGAVPVDKLPDHIHYAEFEKKCRDAGTMSWRGWGLL
jgi:hypothetical protein